MRATVTQPDRAERAALEALLISVGKLKQWKRLAVTCGGLFMAHIVVDLIVFVAWKY